MLKKQPLALSKGIPFFLVSAARLTMLSAIWNKPEN